MKSVNAVELSVIIPTRNRPQDLVPTVESLFKQTVIPQCLMIVDQSPGTESRQLVERVYAVAPPLIRERLSLHYVHDPQISGLAQARNRAMDLLEGGIWLFLDDDVILEPEFIQEILAAYEQHPEAAGISGIVTNYPTPAWGFILWNRVFMRGPFFDDRQPVYWDASRLRDRAPIRVSRLTGAMMSFRAGMIRSIRFDDNRNFSDADDVEFCVSLGPDAPLFIAPRVRLLHNRSLTGRERRHWLAPFSRSAYYLYRRHWRHGLKNRLCFLWFNVGCALVACAASARSRSLEPWGAFVAGAGQGTECIVRHGGSS